MDNEEKKIPYTVSFGILYQCEFIYGPIHKPYDKIKHVKRLVDNMIKNCDVIYMKRYLDRLDLDQIYDYLKYAGYYVINGIGKDYTIAIALNYKRFEIVSMTNKSKLISWGIDKRSAVRCPFVYQLSMIDYKVYSTY